MIPRIAHFVWLGQKLPWVHVLAVASAALRGGFERILFHHTDALDGVRVFEEIGRLERVETRELEASSLLERAGGAALADCYRDLETPASKSNLLRVALLAEQGGVYLDTDTVTLASFERLCARGGAFCGEERLVFPAHAARGIASRLRPSALVRMAARDVCRRLPEGYRGFRRIERFYPTAPNNAVLGAEAGHPFLAELLVRMSAMPRAERRVRYALGTHLLQKTVRDWSRPGLTVLPPATFFPLGPEISEHYFRIRSRVSLDEVIAPETLVAHWYASVRTEPYVAGMTPERVRELADRQIFARLALPIVEAVYGA